MQLVATIMGSAPGEDDYVFIDSDNDHSLCDDYDSVSNAIGRDDLGDASERKWTFHTRSILGVNVSRSLSNCIGTEESILVYTPVGSYLPNSMDKEIEHLMTCG